jgi:hypothetical protein
MKRITKLTVAAMTLLASSVAFASDDPCATVDVPEFKRVLAKAGLNANLTGCFEDRGGVIGFTTTTGGTHYKRLHTDYLLTVDRNNAYVKCGEVHVHILNGDVTTRQIHIEACVEIFGSVNFKRPPKPL